MGLDPSSYSQEKRKQKKQGLDSRVDTGTHRYADADVDTGPTVMSAMVIVSTSAWSYELKSAEELVGAGRVYQWLANLLGPPPQVVSPSIATSVPLWAFRFCSLPLVSLR